MRHNSNRNIDIAGGGSSSSFDSSFFSFELFVLNILQEDVHILPESSCSVCESSVKPGLHDR